MPNRDWRCLVCEASNLAAMKSCQLCRAPLRQSRKEIESARATWSGQHNFAESDGGHLGRPTKIALFTVVYWAALNVLLDLASTSGGNPIGIAIFFGPLFILGPLLVLWWIVAVIRSFGKSRDGK